MTDDLEQEIIKRLDVIQEGHDKRELAKRLDVIQSQQSIIMADLAVVKNLSHSEGTCLLANQVTLLKLSEARRSGIFAVVGVLAIAVVTFLFNWLLRVIGK